jgi:hypothetical protein
MIAEKKQDEELINTQKCKVILVKNCKFWLMHKEVLSISMELSRTCISSLNIDLMKFKVDDTFPSKSCTQLQKKHAELLNIISFILESNSLDQR